MVFSLVDKMRDKIIKKKKIANKSLIICEEFKSLEMMATDFKRSHCEDIKKARGQR